LSFFLPLNRGFFGKSLAMASNKIIEKYYENLCRKHVDIAHGDKTKRFFRIELDEVLLSQLKSDVRFPFVSLERLEYRFVHPAGQASKRKIVALMFVDKSQNSPEKISDTYDRMEEIADDFLNKTYEDIRENLTPFTDFDWNSVDAAQIPYNVTTGVCGIRLVFEAPENYNHSVNTKKWNS